MAKAVEFQIKLKSDDGGVLKNLTVEATNLGDVLSQVGEQAKESGEKLKAMAAKSLVFEDTIRSLDQLRGMIKGAAEPFNSFETAMQGANTMAGKSGEDFDALKDKIVELSKNIPLAREQLANGLYQTISNGVPEDNWIAFLEKSSKAAVGGIADLGQTVTVTSTLIKNYGLSWDAAGEIQDKIQMTAKNGVTSFEQLGQALPRVSGSASQLGVSMDELMAVFATTTGVTGNTAEVSTQLAAVLNALIKPSSEATQAAEAMGIGFNAASVKAAGGLQNFLVGLDTSISQYSAKTGQLKETIYGQLFGSAEALRVLGSLTGEQKDKFAENIQAMSDSAGTIDEAYEHMASTGESTNQMIKNQVQSMLDWAGSIASSSAPYMEWIANTGLAMMAMVQLKTGISAVIGGLRALDIATKAHVALSKVVVVATNAWKVVQMGLNLVMSLNPVGAVVMAIVALIAIIYEAYQNCESFRKICDQVWAAIKEVATVVWDYLVKAFEKVSKVIKTAWEWVKKFFGISDGDTKNIEKKTKAVKDNTKAQEENILAALKANKAQNGKNGKDKDSKKDKYSGEHLIAGASSYKELGNNIQYYQNKLETTKASEKKTLALYAEKIARLQKQQDLLKQIETQALRPKELKTLSDIDAEISYQQALREKASKSGLAAIDKEIACLNDLKTAFERSAHSKVGAEQITTYRQLDNELQYYNDLMRTATATERVEIQKQINALNDLKKKWDETLAALKKPEDIGRLDTIEKLDEAISYYQAKQKKATGVEITAIGETITALEQKRETLNRLTRLPAMNAETVKLDGLGTKELKMELRVIGLDGVKKRIKELQDMLRDTKNPLDKSQRGEVEKLVGSYKKYEKVLRKSDASFENLWGNTKGVAGGISSMTNALEGGQNAWETLTGLVDGAIQIFQGIMGIVDIVKALTMATEMSAAAGQVKAATTASETAAVTTHAAATAADTAATLTNTAAKGGEAIADATASGAKLPFPYNLVAIAAGVAAVVAALASVSGAFAGGGIVGGSSPSGDKLLARVNSGEMILNGAQQSRLFNFINGVTPFADGGIVYGPTLSIMGEYAGARSNPEVIAPLNKLKALIGGDGNGGGRLEARLRGRDLVLALANETRISRRKTNIKI